MLRGLRGVRRDGQDKALAKRDDDLQNFEGSYARGSTMPTLATKPIFSSMPSSKGHYSGTLPYYF